MGPQARKAWAFTLLEILGALSVIAILLALTIPVLQKARAQAKLARAKSDIHKIESALNLYRLDYGIAPIPADAPGLLAAGAGGDYIILNVTATGPLSPSTKQPYLEITSAQMDSATRGFLDPWKTPYGISPAATHNPGNFDVSSSGPDKTKGNADDVNNWSR